MRFNPRARDGRDPSNLFYVAAYHVSIHAPVMDAMPKAYSRAAPFSFNPRARDGRDEWWQL